MMIIKNIIMYFDALLIKMMNKSRTKKKDGGYYIFTFYEQKISNFTISCWD